MKAKIVMLETNNPTNIILGGKLHFKNENFRPISYIDYKHQHLYLIDEKAETKAFDWWYNKHDNKIGQYGEQDPPQSHYVSKIIASTDKSLIIDKADNTERNAEIDYRGSSQINEEFDVIVPQLSEQSIKLLINYYNQHGKMPDEVGVEKGTKKVYDNLGGHPGGHWEFDGTVDITIPEEIILTWKQVEMMLSKFICEYAPHTSNKFNAGIYLNNWLKENLK